jgi:uncharacterized protein (TIGR03083 family)
MSSRTDTITNLEATWAAMDIVAGSLTPEQWASQSLCPAWTTHGVLAHATSIEQVLVGWDPGGDAPFARIGTVHQELAALSDDELLAQFRAIVEQRRAELGAMTDDDFATHGPTPIGPASYARFMDIRMFDNWVHERDMRIPLGIGGDDSGPTAEKSLDEVHNSLGYIVGKKVGLDDGKSIAFDISGPVSRRMFVRVDGRAAVVDELPDPDATLTTDFLTFMLLACGRIDPEEPIGDGRVTWTGDDEIGARAARNLRFTI